MANLFSLLLVIFCSSGIWLSWYKRKDLENPRHRSPRWVYKYFAGGIASCLAALLVETLEMEALTIEEDGFWGQVITAGLPEESVKSLAFWLLIRRERLREPFDACARAAAVGLGFAVCENFLYGLGRGLGVAVLRSLFTAQGHSLFAMLGAYFWAWTRLDPSLRRERHWRGLPCFGFFLAVILHAGHNTIENGYILRAFELLCWVAFAAGIRKLEERSPYRAWPSSECEQALQVIDTGLRVDPDNPDLLFRRGLYSIAAGLWDEALVGFDGASQTGSRQALLNSFYAAALFSQGQEAKAYALFDRYWPETTNKERRFFHKALKRMLPDRYVYTSGIRQITRSLEWTPRPAGHIP